MATLLRATILLVFASHSTWSTEVKSKGFVWLNRGQSFTMRCSTSHTDYDGLYLVLGLHEEKEVFFLYGKTNKLTVENEYGSRLQKEGELNDLKITLANMTEDDSGVYWCRYRRTNKNSLKTERFAGDGSTMVVVNGKPCPTNNGKAMTSNLVVVSAISAASVFLLCLIVLLLWLVPRMKRSMKKRQVHAQRSDSVYEDMRKNHTPHRTRQPNQPTNHFP